MTIGRRAANAQFRVALLPWMVAGVRTQFENLQRLPVPDDMLVDVYPIVPFRENGLIERLPFLQASQKGTLRSTLHALPVLRSRYDAIWTQTLLPMVPAMAVHAALRERYPAIIYTIDTTPALMDELTTLYYGRPQPGPRKRRLRDALFRYGLERCTLVTPWSRWAARSFAGQYGVPEDRIRVIPPGIDIIAWSVAARDAATDRPLRLLFVGADFERKGGLLLLDVYRRHLRGRCELHMVTRDRVPEEPGVRVYAGFGPNDEGLRALYARCDALVLPTRADCFSLAALEAMASGLPVIICPMGGIPEIVEHGKTGFLVPPDDGTALLAAIEVLLADRAQAQRLGQAGRAVVEARFDNAVQSRVLLDLLGSLGATRKAEVRMRIPRRPQG